MEVDIKEYLSNEEIKEICKAHLRMQLQQEGERLATNMAYSAAAQIIDEAFSNEEKTVLKTRVRKVIEDCSSYNLFRKKDAWGSEESVAYRALQEAVSENIPTLKVRVAEVMEAYPISEELFKNSDLMAEVLVNTLRKGFGKEY